MYRVANAGTFSINGEECTLQTPGLERSLRLPKGYLVNNQRFQIEPGDQWQSDADRGSNVERCEFRHATNYTHGDDIWMAYHLRVNDAQHDSNFLICGQMHGGDNVVGRSPWAVLQVSATGARVLRRHHPEGEGSVTTSTEDAGFTLGVWHHVVFNIKAAEAGKVKIWIDGSAVMNHEGAAGFLDEDGAGYWKFGIYRAADGVTAVVDYSNMTIGTADLSGLVSSPPAAPDW